jgi:hypothetical protein
LIFSPRGGPVHQLDICGSKAKWLLRKGECRQRRPGWRWYQDAVVRPVHDDN